MRTMTRWGPAVQAGILAMLALPVQAAAEPATSWSDKAELSYVATDGNAEASTIGFKNELIRKWEKSVFALKTGGIRVETTKFTRFAVGPDDMNFTITEQTDQEITAENYYLNGRYGRTINEHYYWHVGAGWERNEPSGTRNRYSGVAGVGNIWIRRDDLTFRTDYGLTFTKQEDIVELPGINDTFAGLRITSKYEKKFGETTTFLNDTILDENFDETSDLRVDMTNSVSVTMNSRLALKVSLQWLFDNEPAFEQVGLFIPPNVFPGTPDELVPRELDNLDTIFTTSLVINF